MLDRDGNWQWLTLEDLGYDEEQVERWELHCTKLIDHNEHEAKHWSLSNLEVTSMANGSRSCAGCCRLLWSYRLQLVEQ
ncbi:hypothetical protein [Paenibacillus sp. KR2-11]|uniref:hypothetical protein n=1 Tax=Paenibacillus sp. KR2-11 TaxID=3385500 RepID=UPI0038FC6DED|nr:hypothetical protein [Paenibacillus caseinilyticus]